MEKTRLSPPRAATLLCFVVACSGSAASAPAEDAGSADGALSPTGDAAAADASADAASDAAAEAAVTSCTGVPAAGAWDTASISPVTFTDTANPGAFTGKSMAIAVDPFDSATVWLGTGNSGLFRSTDCGGTWTHVNTGANGTALDQSSLWSMAIDPVHRGTIYVTADYGSGYLWKSVNGGVDWTDVVASSAWYPYLYGSDADHNNSFVNNVSMDPNNPLHLVAMSHGNCNPMYPNGCIAETTDGGATWSNIVSMPQPWSEKGGVQIIDATTWIWGGGDQQLGLYVTKDNGQTWTQAVPGGSGDGVGELSTQSLARAVDGAYYIPSLEGVLRSTDGLAWTRAWQPLNAGNAVVMAVAVTATTIYASDGEFYSAPLGDYATWAPMTSPATQDDPAEFLALDEAHHVLYASCWAGGVFRFGVP